MRIELRARHNSHQGLVGIAEGQVGTDIDSLFVAFVETEVEVVSLRSPLPWTVALCRSRAEPRT